MIRTELTDTPSHFGQELDHVVPILKVDGFRRDLACFRVHVVVIAQRDAQRSRDVVPSLKNGGFAGSPGHEGSLKPKRRVGPDESICLFVDEPGQSRIEDAGPVPGPEDHPISLPGIGLFSGTFQTNDPVIGLDQLWRRHSLDRANESFFFCPG